jgi:hypothetical protein
MELVLITIQQTVANLSSVTLEMPVSRLPLFRNAHGEISGVKILLPQQTIIVVSRIFHRNILKF